MEGHWLHLIAFSFLSFLIITHLIWIICYCYVLWKAANEESIPSLLLITIDMLKYGLVACIKLNRINENMHFNIV